MITFTKVKYQNFLGTGNAPIALDLDEYATTLIIGKNGAGKSTVSEAICFALFGKPLRNVTKPKLVNSVNQKDCLVELWFTTSTGHYLIKRGIKPAIFEIYRNDVLEPVPANVDDYQETLESILKLDYKSFKQVVILGSASYVPFMRLPTPARRDIIEDLLDIEVFSSMNALAKEDVSELKQAIEKCGLKRKSITEQLRIAKEFTDHLATQTKQQIDLVTAEIEKQRASIAALREERVEREAELAPVPGAIALHTKLSDNKREYERMLDKLETKYAKLDKDHEFYADHTNCPECEQIITEEFKTAKFAALDTNIVKVQGALAECERRMNAVAADIKAQEIIMAAGRATNERIKEIDRAIGYGVRRIGEYEQQVTALEQTPTSAPTVDIAALSAQLAALNTEHDTLSKRKVVLDAATMLLKDNGIKTRVVKHYLPIINKHINHYLTAMDFPILFQFDESFEESMKSRHRDEFTYELFSEGEKKRIDLALLLTWRAIAKLKNSASTNLLLLDEVFDSSLDAAGIEEFLKIIGSLEKDTNVIVISHRGEQLFDKFEHAVTVEKFKGFSRIKP